MPPAQAADHGHGHDPYDVQAGRADAASPGTAGVLTREFTAAAAALKTPLRVRPGPAARASDSTGSSLFFLVVAWMLGGYVGATTLGAVLGGVRSSSCRSVSGPTGHAPRARPASTPPARRAPAG